MRKNQTGTFNKSSRGDYGTGKCSKCNIGNLEKYKICINCFGSKRPEKTKENSVKYKRNGGKRSAFE